MSALSTPHQAYREFVQSGMIDGQFISAAFTLLAAGPPRLSAVGGANAAGIAASEGGNAVDKMFFPLGILQNFNLSHNRNFNRIFEIGSERSYFISGRTVGQIGLSRVLYHGPSLLRVLYAYYQDLLPPTVIPPVFPNVATGAVANQHNTIIPPGYENIFLNLASDLFSQPIGLLLYIKDSNEDTVGAIYLESCYVPNHTIATDANGVIMQESGSLQFERGVPVAVRAISLISGGQVV